MQKILALCALCLAAAAAQTTSAAAQEKSPSHVYQIVGELEHYVRHLLKADLIDPADRSISAASNKNPRHVFAKLIEVDQKIAMLCRLNGLPSGRGLAFPPRKVSPGDVYDGVRTVSKHLIDLAAHYELPEGTFDEDLSEGKKPGDVYARLDFVSDLLDMSDIPATVPNDVFRVAASTRSLTEALLGRLDMPVKPYEMNVTNLRPADVYEAVVSLSGEMEHFVARNPDIAPAGGVFAPPAAPARITPAEVRDALNMVIADLQGIWVASGATEQLEVIPMPTGMTPTDVYRQVEHARALLAATQS